MIPGPSGFYKGVFEKVQKGLCLYAL